MTKKEAAIVIAHLVKSSVSGIVGYAVFNATTTPGAWSIVLSLVGLNAAVRCGGYFIGALSHLLDPKFDAFIDAWQSKFMEDNGREPNIIETHAAIKQRVNDLYD